MFTSYRVIDMVRKKISTEHLTASDTDVARAIGLSRAAVSAYKTGRDIMTHETLARANELLKLPDLDIANIGFDLLLERARTDNERAIYRSMRDIARYARTWVKSRASSILLSGLAIGLLSAPQKTQAFEHPAGPANGASSVYYVNIPDDADLGGSFGITPDCAPM